MSYKTSTELVNGVQTVCVTELFPTFNDLIDACSVDSTDSMFEELHFPRLQGIYTASQVLGETIKRVLMSILETLAGVIGLTASDILTPLDSTFKSLCGLPVNIADAISGNYSAMVESIKTVWISDGSFFGGLNAPTLEIVEVLNEVMNNFYSLAIDGISSIVTSVSNHISNALEISFSLPSVPTMPTMTQLSSLYASNGSWSDFIGEVKGIMPILPDVPSFPSPLFPHVSAPNLEARVTVSNFYMVAMGSLVENIITNIVDPVKNVLGLTFPPAGMLPCCISINTQQA